MQIEYPPTPDSKESSTLGNVTASIMLVCLIVLMLGGTVRALMWMFG